jgi:hypothetical protein
MLLKSSKSEDKRMVYSKPEVTKLASSLEAVQHPTLKVQASLLEMPQNPYDVTPSAYAADE